MAVSEHSEPLYRGSEWIVVQLPAAGRMREWTQVGLVGMPNVGKSTLYNSLSKSALPIEVKDVRLVNHRAH